jgi:hypothetical protein
MAVLTRPSRQRRPYASENALSRTCAPSRAQTGQGPHRSPRTGSRDVFRAVTRTNAGHGHAVAPAPVTNAVSDLAMPAWHPADDACIRGAASACVAPLSTLALDEDRASAGAQSAPNRAPASVESSSHAPAIAFHAIRHSGRGAACAFPRCCFRLAAQAAAPPTGLPSSMRSDSADASPSADLRLRRDLDLQRRDRHPGERGAVEEGQPVSGSATACRPTQQRRTIEACARTAPLPRSRSLPRVRTIGRISPDPITEFPQVGGGSTGGECS